MQAVRVLKSQKGFSLIELMVVVAIIGILATIAVPNFTKFQNKARQAEAKTYLASIYTAERAFSVEYNSFISCMEAIGFDREGANPRYVAGFTAVHLNTATGYSGACAIANRGGAPAGVTTSTTPGAFVAGASATLNGNDAWTINQARTLTNAVSGL